MQTEVFWTFIWEGDAIISDSLNASIIDGVWCAKQLVTVMQITMADLEQQLIKANEGKSF
jgi:hypothetical protein